LAGTLFGDGDVGVILTHQGTTGSDQTTWQPFAEVAAGQGYSALTFDFRGIGLSEGDINFEKVGVDVGAAVDFMLDRGFDRIVCIGASMGGTACISAALEYDLTGMVVFASTMRVGMTTNALVVQSEDLANLTLPKLFLTAEDDSFLVVDQTKRMYEQSPDPKELILFPGSEHGTLLFNTDVGVELTRTLLEFLEHLSSESER